MKNKALILENNVAAMDILAEELEALGFEVVVVSNGPEVLESLCAYRPQLIFLSSASGDISGYQLCRFLKNKEEYKDIPIIMLTDKPEDKLKLWNIKTTADYCFLKPFNREDLSARLKDLVANFSNQIICADFQEKLKFFNSAVKNLSLVYCRDMDLNSEDVRICFQRLIEIITAMMKSQRGSLMLADTGKNLLFIKAAVGLDEEIMRNTKVEIGSGISGWVARNQRPLLVKDIEAEKNFAKENNSDYHTKSFISIPLKFGKVTGVININNKNNKEIYNISDLNFLLTLINHVSFALDNAALRIKVKDAEHYMKKADSMNEILIEANKFLDKELYETTISNEVNKIITADLDYRQTVNAVIEIVDHLVDFHFCGLLLIDEEARGEVIINIKYPATENDVYKFKTRIVEAFNELTNKVVLKDEVLFNQNDSITIAAPKVGDGSDDILSSFQAHLLHNAERVLGLLAISHSRKDAFTKEDLKLFSIITQRSIPAINNAALHRKIKELSNRDDLTGLYRYGYLQEQLERELTRAERYKNSLGIIMLDIDNFKQINDLYGHHQGDVVLRELSSILNKICRNVDIITRYGGEEFVVILPETDKDGAFYLAERIRRVVKNYSFSSAAPDTVPGPVKITISLGVVSYPATASSKEELLKKVDAALYQAKKDGKNISCQL
ncbi:MAG: diguanylate cyclase [Candidatus Omnitrophota bacterium]